MKLGTLSLGIVLLLAGCSTTNVTTTDEVVSNNDFNFTFRYGITAKNVLNTFEHTYTKDLITSPSVTVPFELSPSELASVEAKIDELQLFDQNPSTNTIHMATQPCENYYLAIQHGATQRNFSWDNCNDALTVPEQAFVDFIVPMIESHPEYQALPEPTGGYL